MPGTKIAVIVLIVIAVVFVLVFGIGSHKDGSEPEAKHFQDSWLADLFRDVKPTPFKEKEIEGDCFKRTTRTIVAPCSVRILPSDSRSRLLALKLVSRWVANVTYEPDSKDPDIQKLKNTYNWRDPGGPNPQHIAIDQGGGLLRLACPGSPGLTCQFRVE